jgi:two-component system chemotaxis response regulator CheY
MFPPSTKVLILDDMMTMRKIVTKTLKEIGFVDILEAADGNQGWELLSTLNPPVQLIISDWNMPNCTGLELLKKVRADARYQKVPFILLTAESEAHQVAQALSIGVSGYIIKPFTSDSIREKLEQIHKKTAA